jgi:hypothetical protein
MLNAASIESFEFSTASTMSSQRSLVTSGLVLFFLSPIIAELLSGSNPPIQFFFNMPLPPALYGGGVLID